jgi:hypothetical protein
LLAIRDEIRADPELPARIRTKFAIKNTSGYRLDAFLDADGSCATACPAGIDTGHVMKELRQARHGGAAGRATLKAASLRPPQPGAVESCAVARREGLASEHVNSAAFRVAFHRCIK